MTTRTSFHRGQAAMLALVLVLPGAAWADTIIYTPESGKQAKRGVMVTSDLADVIRYFPPRATKYREESSFDVVLVEYDNAPDEYKRALGYINRGAWYDAIRNLEKAMADVAKAKAEQGEEETSLRLDWVDQYANYHLGECYRQRAVRHPEEFAKAEEAYRKVTGMQPTPRLWGDAMIGLARTLAAQENHAEAIRLLDDVAGKARRKEIAPPLELRARIARAEVKEQSGDHRGAAADFDRLALDVEKENPQRALRYRLRAGFSLLAGENTSDARRSFESLRDTEPESSLAQAGAWTGLGELALERGDLPQAREAFAHTLAMYGAHGVYYDRALAGMVRVMRQLGSQEEGSQKLAEGYLDELRHRDPTSPFLEGL